MARLFAEADGDSEYGDSEESQSDGEPESDFVSDIESDDPPNCKRQLMSSEAELQSPDGSAFTRPTDLLVICNLLKRQEKAY